MTWVQRMQIFSFAALPVSIHQVKMAAAISGSQLMKPALREPRDRTSCSSMKKTFRVQVFRNFRKARFRTMVTMLLINPLTPPRIRLPAPINRHWTDWAMRIWDFFFRRPMPTMIRQPIMETALPTSKGFVDDHTFQENGDGAKAERLSLYGEKTNGFPA